ncbi:hypothetical protein VTL71DRAFT_4983 [Oculimacula yallundae]|uniref:Uncharacterized protein n=1 Tax=Oculimacula yallundae TaxID=86028 RepID=A0ABR4C5E4_9HELO
MSVRETYKIAHTARCKLQMAADRPDRDLRFILGHAFTLDKLRLRIAEIEVSGSSDSDSEPEDDLPRAVCDGSHAQTKPGEMGGRRVSFQTGKAGGNGNGIGIKGEKDRRRSPPPPVQTPVLEEDTESDEDDIEEDVEDEEEDLGLVRFGSAAAQPPRIVDDEADVETGGVEVLEGQEIEALDPKKYSEEELRKLCEGQSSQELRDAYTGVAGCPCHGKHGPQIENFWELPQPEGVVGPRLAIMQVA